MKLVLLLAILHGPSGAPHLADAPVATTPEAPQGPGFVLGEGTLDETPLLDIRATVGGEPAPGKGCWMDAKACVDVARRARACETERDAMRQGVGLALPLSAAFALGLIGGAVGYWLLHRTP